MLTCKQLWIFFDEEASSIKKVKQLISTFRIPERPAKGEKIRNEVPCYQYL